MNCDNLVGRVVLDLKSGQQGTEIWLELDADLGVLGSQDNTPDDTSGINNAVTCPKEVIQLVLSINN